VRRALRSGTITLIDSTKTTGLIFVPGTMVGMLLAGASPTDAVRLQLILLYAAGLAGKELDAERCLHLAGLDPGFGGRDVAKLSVGEQQRAMLARALAQRPRVLLLDEPTSALDEAARDAVEATLAHLRSELEISLVVVTHDPAQARRLGEWAIRLEAGRVVACGRLEEAMG
jgi:ABC-type cobalamin/Fe3+-siderophores transport system ATPase subunit